MKTLILMLLFICAAYTADVSFAGQAKIPYVNKSVNPEFIGFAINFSSDIRNEERRIVAIENATKTFWSSVLNDNTIIKFIDNTVSDRNYGGSGSSKFSIISSSEAREQVKEITFILRKISDNETALSASKALNFICQQVKLNDDVKIHLSGFYQGIFDANKHRAELISGIIADLKKNSESGNITGLENNVMVSFYQNGLLRVFIPYNYEINISK